MILKAFFKSNSCVSFKLSSVDIFTLVTVGFDSVCSPSTFTMRALVCRFLLSSVESFSKQQVFKGRQGMLKCLFHGLF